MMLDSTQSYQTKHGFHALLLTKIASTFFVLFLLQGCAKPPLSPDPATVKSIGVIGADHADK
ncbi:MAG: hypothetical protein HQL71_15490 [Magnetococcales bacterium]|nr:hypothetical protein [Magnetococcales bacterium]